MYLTGEAGTMGISQVVVYKHNPYKNAKYIKVFKMFCTAKIKYIRMFLCLLSVDTLPTAYMQKPRCS